MKTTVEVPDDLYRQAKAEAALRGRKLRDLIEEGLRPVLESPRKRRRRPSLAGLMKGARAFAPLDAGALGWRGRGATIESAFVSSRYPGII